MRPILPPSRLLCVLCAAVVQLGLMAGCSTTTYEKTLVNGDKVKLSATSFLIKREIGEIVIAGDKLGGAKTDQSAVAQLLGEALLARAAK
jgi:hypothetical protein